MEGGRNGRTDRGSKGGKDRRDGVKIEGGREREREGGYELGRTHGWQTD